MKFVVQNRIYHDDIGNELRHQKEYYDWLNAGRTKDMQTEFIMCKYSELNNVLPNGDYKEWCPVGTVEFCVDWYERIWGLTPLPKNVPDELISKCYRKILPFSLENLKLFGKKIFRKDTKIIKSKYNGIVDNISINFNNGDHYPITDFQISEIIPDIYSEWRCFIYKGELIDIKNYDGDPFNIPNKEYIYELIKKYKSAPVAYTLDLAQTNYGTEVIEVHDFFGCGLYGFSSPQYPFMLWRWFKEFTKNK